MTVLMLLPGHLMTLINNMFNKEKEVPLATKTSLLELIEFLFN